MKKSKRKLYYGGGRFLVASDELRDSVAYRGLEHAHKIVFLDMLRTYLKPSYGDTKDISDDGFMFAFGHCREPVSRATFYRAIHRILDVGLFEHRVDQQHPLRGGQPTVFAPTDRWRSFDRREAGKATQADLTRMDDRKRKQLKRDSRRRQDFLERHTHDDKEQCAHHDKDRK